MLVIVINEAVALKLENHQIESQLPEISSLLDSLSLKVLEEAAFFEICDNQLLEQMTWSQYGDAFVAMSVSKGPETESYSTQSTDGLNQAQVFEEIQALLEGDDYEEGYDYEFHFVTQN